MLRSELPINLLLARLELLLRFQSTALQAEVLLAVARSREVGGETGFDLLGHEGAGRIQEFGNIQVVCADHQVQGLDRVGAKELILKKLFNQFRVGFWHSGIVRIITRGRGLGMG